MSAPGLIRACALACISLIWVTSVQAENERGTGPEIIKAETGFGAFAFTVNPDRTQIISLSVHLKDYQCGSISITGRIEADSPRMWPVVDQGFHAETDLGIYRVEIMGNLEKSGSKAHGNWIIHSGSTECSGSWMAD